MNKECEPDLCSDHCDQNLARYVFTEELNERARGAYGIIWFVKDRETGQEMTLKLLLLEKPFDREFYDEAHIGCKLSGQPGFIHLARSFLCPLEGHEPLWTRKVTRGREYDKMGLGYAIGVLEMERADGGLRALIEETRVSEIEKCMLFFEAVHHLDLAFRQLGFLHGDIALRNLVYNKSRTIREYDAYGLTVDSELFPLWIDFGMSQLSVDHFRVYDDQLRHLINQFEFADERKNDFHSATYKMDRNREKNYSTLLRAIRDEINALRLNPAAQQGLMRRMTFDCSVCRDKTSLYSRQMNRFFCGKQCLQTTEGV